MKYIANKKTSRVRVFRVVGNVGFYMLVVLMLALFLFVFVWMVLTSLKYAVDVTSYPPVWFFKPTLSNYTAVFNKTPFLQHLKNSLIVAFLTVFISLFVSTLAAYSIARYKQKRLALVILVIRMIPAVVFGLPFFMIFRALGLIDSHVGLVISHMTLVVPLAIWILIGFFEDVPPELEEAARIDGTSRAGAFFRVSLPLCLPGLSVAAILGFIYSWNNFLFVLILGGRNSMTLPMAVYSFMVFENIQFGPLAAAATLIILPIVVLALFAQRYLISGLSMGAVKG